MSRNELYACGIFDRRPTVHRMIKGFSSRLACVTSILGGTKEVEQAIKQLGKVGRCLGSYERTNGKTFFNLFQASAKLNDMLLLLETDAEEKLRPDCDTCLHKGHIAGRCRECDCGISEVIGGY